MQQYAEEARTRRVLFAAKLAATETLIAPVTVTPSDAALVASLISFDDVSARVRISGGVAGGRYTVAVVAGTNFGNTVESNLAVEVQ